MAIGGDPHWGKVASLLHFDGPDGTASFSDETGRVWSGAGNVHIASDQAVFGRSAYFDGSGDYLFTGSDPKLSASQNFCFEARVRLSSQKAIHTIASTRGAEAGAEAIGWQFVIENDHLRLVVWSASGAEIALLDDAGELLPDAWVAVAFSMQEEEDESYTWRMFRAGELVAQKSTTQPGGSSPYQFSIGRDPSNTSRYLHGHLDEVRITFGESRHTASYAISGQPFPDHGLPVSGHVSLIDGTPVGRTIRFFRLDTGALVGETASDPISGDYSVEISYGDEIIGLVYQDYGRAWQPEVSVAIGDRTWPRIAPNDHWYLADQAGVTGAIEPDWSTIGGAVIDGSVVWSDQGVMEHPVAEGPFLPLVDG